MLFSMGDGDDLRKDKHQALEFHRPVLTPFLDNPLPLLGVV